MRRCLNCMEEYEDQESRCPFCGWDCSREKGAWLEPGSILQGRYIIGTARRRGKADILYIGWDALFSRKVLVMEYVPRSCAARNGMGALQVFDAKSEAFQVGLEKYRMDAQRMILLDDTKGLLNVFGVVEENGTAYAILEYPGEVTLRQVLLEEGPRSLEQTEKLIRDLSSPLIAAHRMQVYHGQLSLGCCYVLPSGEYRIGCFNEAAYLTGDVPEDNKESLGPAMDIFELAHIAGAAMMGVETWEKHPVDENLGEIADVFPEYVAETLLKAMHEDQSRRPLSIRRFLDELMNEATVEMPSNRVWQDEEQDKKSSFRWKHIFPG